LQEWNGEQLIGYNANDVQLEFTMLDPYYRLTLQPDVSASTPEVTIYKTEFKIPEQYGMYTFRTFYRRAGLSFVDAEEIVTVRHIANDEWPRSWQITNAWVYLTSAVTVIAGWFTFVVLYLYSGKAQDESEEKKK
jgi:oligosaccharyltransferase complex subunit beta